MMDDERIERALRQGPPDEPAYEPGQFARTLGLARPTPTRRGRRLWAGLGGTARLAATGAIVAVIVAGVVVVRSGYLGIGASPSPGSVGGHDGGATAIAAGTAHTCALSRTGGVKCWGGNGYGQLGNGSTTDSVVPVDVAGLTNGVIAIAAGGNHSCALTSRGGVKCWGQNTYGQLGNGSTGDSSVPVDVSGLTSGVKAIAAAADDTIELTTGGGVKMWGDARGQLGNGSTVGSNVPIDVPGLTSGVAAIAGGGTHTCALTSGGGVKCWGDDGYGQLGDGSASYSGTPVDVRALASGVAVIALGGTSTCAVASAGGVMCWGYNGDGQLGDGSTTSSNIPVAVVGATGRFTAISGGEGHFCALTSEGSVACWGLNGNGQLGNGSKSNSTGPVEVSGLASDVTAVAAGDTHTCALSSRGGVLCWGGNTSGQLGDGTKTEARTPVEVRGL